MYVPGSTHFEEEAMRKAYAVTDLGFGDSGKGTITDALVRHEDASLVVRYNGGAQAAHTVVDSEGIKHTFAHVGSGSLVTGVDTFLSRHMLIHPLAFLREQKELAGIGVTDIAERVYIDGSALVTAPYHMAANRIREYLRGQGRHGSCGLGIGETVEDRLEYGDEVLVMADLLNEDLLGQKLEWVRRIKQQQLEEGIAELNRQDNLPDSMLTALDQLYSDDELEASIEMYAYMARMVQVVDGDYLGTRLHVDDGVVVFEGAQGVLLDQDWGFHPHTTWSTTTSENARDLLEEADFDGETTVLGVMRAYQTRHGAGPLPTESAELSLLLQDPHNPTNAWQGAFRFGWLDLCLLRYALEADGHIDGLAITCLDQLELMNGPRIGCRYSLDGSPFELLRGDRYDLEEREVMGRRLAEVDVTYEYAPSDPGKYVATIEERLGVPLVIASYGMTAEEKDLVVSV
jgi:adenylosuccinate synthase